jgi:hypothetical protein
LTQAYANLDLRGDTVEARKPSIRFLFEFPELLRLFETIDPEAQRARQLSRTLGFASIGLVLGALLLASADPAMETLDPGLRESLGYAAAGLGLAGTLLGLATRGHASPRARWLRVRMQTEILRLFHFHFTAQRLPEGLRAAGDPAAEIAWRAERTAALERLRQKILTDPGATYVRLLADRDFAPFAGLVAHEPEGTLGNRAAADDVFAAWRALRLEWQLGYCDAKLAHDGAPRRQEVLFSRIAWSCIAVIVALHFMHFFEHALHIPRVLLQTAVVWTALIALGARAFESGLAPQREVERYEQYRSNICVALRRFDDAPSTQARIEVMRAFEATSQEEMLVFIRTHASSHFLL